MAPTNSLLVQVQTVLSKSAWLQSRGLVETEASQILLESYKKFRNFPLDRIEMLMGQADFSEQEQQRIIAIAEKRSQGEPLQYLLGTQQFLDHELNVAPGVLVPRPETEFLVTVALDRIKARFQRVSLGLEVGLGSGAISISLISELIRRNPEFQMLATEVSENARSQALRNRDLILREHAHQLEVLPVSDADHVLEPFISWLGTDRRADFLISNPPYLDVVDEIDLDVSTHEPHEALYAPPGRPLYFYQKMAPTGKSLLKPEGLVFVEIPSQRGIEIENTFLEFGWKTELVMDLAGLPRVLVASGEV